MDVAELQRQVEQKFAPGPLLAVQAFANTLSYDPREELLADPAAARRWLVDSDLATESISVSSGELELLIELRAAVREMLDANLTGEDPAAARSTLAGLAASHPVPLALGGGGALTVDTSPVSTVDDFVAQALGLIAVAQLEGTWERLKVCGSDDCRWAFYDASRNRGGTWCQMEVCGNRVKNRRYRERASEPG